MLRKIRKHADPRRGFTLIELMIVVGIIALLATVAIPEFNSFSMRAKKSEREVISTAIMRAINDHWITHTKLPGTPPTLLLPPNPPYLPDGSKQPFSTTLGDWGQLVWRPDGPLYYRYDIAATVSGSSGTLFLTARADLDRNGVPNVKVFTYQLLDGIWQRSGETESTEPF